MPDLTKLARALDEAEAILVGVGAGFSAAAGLRYDGERFLARFRDFHDKYDIPDMYSGGFYPFPTEAERWAWWSRHVLYNRYEPGPLAAYLDLLKILQGRDYFVVTTNVDHQFQKAGIDKSRFYYMQGDYGLFECAEPCCQKTWDNEAAIRAMAAAEAKTAMQVPPELFPCCPYCGGPARLNLRVDERFVQDAGWYAGLERYRAFLERVADKRLLLLELGVGMNTPGLIKFPFWRIAKADPQACYVSINLFPYAPEEIRPRSLLLAADVAEVVGALAER